VIETADAVALCFLSPVVELLSPSEVATHPALARLGPDLLKPEFDPAQARRHLRERAHVQIGVALVDQTALAGIGNVYKSEALFLSGVSPFARVGGLDDATLDRLVAVARELMRRNLEEARAGRRRRSRPAALGLPAVGPALPEVRDRDRRAVQGEQTRPTYFCPTCQRSASDAPEG
jgi:endonuclease-8